MPGRGWSIIQRPATGLGCAFTVTVRELFVTGDKEIV